ncbi:MAG: tetratricopeptide repeat protein [Planctomycetes bacterium]|nr:tetratricopeptide repeat protein [Planctomycetota bacterium]
MPTNDDKLAAALILYEQKNYAGAEQLARPVLEQQPRSAHALHLMCLIARKTDRVDVALEMIRRALKIDANKAVYHFELGAALRLKGRDEEAKQAFIEAVRLDGDFQEAALNVGGVLDDYERYEEALPWSEKAVQLNSECPIAHYNLANVQRAMGRLDEAIESYRRALAIKPRYLKARWNYAVTLLTAGRFAEGWREYEHRAAVGEVHIDRFTEPRWDGSSLSGKTIVVHAEQGVGDEVMFATCFPEVIARAEHCYIVCEPRLEMLFARSFPGATVIGHQRRKGWEPPRLPEKVDWQIPAGSVPGFFRPDWESFPRAERLLTPDAAQVEHWEARLAELGEGLKVGISWQAGGKPAERRKRTTTLDQWRDIFAAPGVHFINLQYGECSEEIEAARRQMGVTIHDFQEGDPLVDLDEFAAKVAALDLVISVGNATVHMAGAVGTPAWAMLPLVPAWRWHVRGSQSPWYASVRLFRQRERTRWQPVFEEVARSLHEKVGQPFPEAGLVQQASCLSTDSVTDSHESSHEEPLPNVSTALHHRSDRFSSQSIHDAFETGVAHHQAGRLEEAEQVYREILQHAPRYSGAMHLLGVVAMQTGRTELAIKSIRRALAIDDNSPLVHFNLGNALRSAEQHDEAIDAYRRAIELDPQAAAARMNLGATLADVGRHEEAVAVLRALLEVAPRVAEIHLNLADSLRATCRIDEARSVYQRTIALDPNLPKAHNNLGKLLLDDGCLDEAAACFTKATEIDPQYAAAHNNLGNVLVEQNRIDEAATQYLRAIEGLPSNSQIVCNLAQVRRLQGRLPEAADLYRRALEIAPRNAVTLDRLGTVLRDCGQTEQAMTSYGRAIEIDSRFAQARYNRALLLLGSGKFDEAWKDYHWRWHQQGGPRPRDFYRQTLWDGSSLAGKTILIHGEQGIGDEIMFATCIPEIIQQAGHCVVTCSRRLERLFARSFPEATVCGMTRGREHIWRPPAGVQIDVQAPAGDLPKFTRRSRENFPKQARLLTPDADLVQQWRQRLDELGSGIKVGVVWRAGTKPLDMRRRSTELTQWNRVLSAAGVQFINLQQGNCREELEQAGRALGTTVHHFDDVDALANIDSAAALTAALDLVIGVGSAAVHLAAALGVETWALLPKFWSLGWCFDEAWYGSLKSIRQTTAGDWEELLGRVAGELQRRITTPRQQPDPQHPIPSPHQSAWFRAPTEQPSA